MKPLLLQAGVVRPASFWKTRFGRVAGFCGLWMCALGGVTAAAQTTTTISGTVFDPRTTAASLPLPQVLVYATTGTVAALPAGVQCLQPSAPVGATSYTNSAVDGSFTLKNIPVNSDYTIVIQSGKWRRQFAQHVDAGPIAGLALHMPSDHTQGDIPMIAISTGSVDGLECVLRDMGIADTEFTDDQGTVNAGGHIHLYNGGGSYIGATSANEAALTEDATKLDSYDVAMFPCNGGPTVKTGTALKNLVDFANAGGRVFATHFSYDWLDPDAPYDSPFPPVANWDLFGGTNQNSAVATVNTAFTDGATLAQWLQNAGATVPGSTNQIEVSTIRKDLDSVIPPTQSWLSIPSKTTSPDWILQLTFNTPVGAPAAQQCGRVLFNEYHVVNFNSTTTLPFPTECGSATAPMSPQEEMLEYALFDLSAFEQPVVVPTLTATFDPSPLPVKPGDTADVVTLNTQNTSATAVIDSAAVLTFTLPPLLTATAMTDPSGGWVCTVSTLKCTRSTSIAPKATGTVSITLSVAQYGAGGPPNGSTITATISDPTFSNNVTASDVVVYRQAPAITWATPKPIVYGTALSGVQLDATASTAGTFAYTPAAGTVLAAGQHVLSATFTPADESTYFDATATVTLTVVSATPQVNLTATPNPAFISNPVGFSASVPSAASAPTGTVAFYDGATQVGSSALTAGSGALTTSSLGLGMHMMTAAYSGDANYVSATSAGLPVLMEDFSLTPKGSTAGGVTVYPGKGASYSILVAPIGGPTLPQAMSLSATNLPDGASYSFSSATIAANSPATTVTLTVTPSSLSAKGSGTGRGALPMALGLMLLPLAAMRRRAAWLRMVLVAACGVALAAGVSACGGVTYTPRSFTITVTAASGALSHTTTVPITVE